MPYIIELDPPLHARIRGLVARAFTPRRVNELEPRIEAIASELIDELAPRGHADIVEDFAWPLPASRARRAVRVPARGARQIHRWGIDWLLLQQQRPVEEQLGHARGVIELQRYCVAAVEDRRRNPTDDLLGAMVAANDGAEEPLSTIEIAGLPLDLMVAGHVTVTRAIGSTLRRMFAEPRCATTLPTPCGARRRSRRSSGSNLPRKGSSAVTTREVELGGRSSRRVRG